MAIDLEHLHKDLLELKRDMNVIKHILSEEGKLSDWAKAELKKARAEPEENYSDLNDI